MPLFGKRNGDMSPEEQAAARQRQRELMQTIGATMSDVGANLSGNQGSQLAALEARRQKLAMQQQQQQAYADLMGSYRGPDMETAGVNDLIGGANEAGFRFDQAPMQRQEPRYQQGFNPAAIGTFLGQGGSAADAKAMQELLNPKPEYTRVAPGEVVYDQYGNEVMRGDPRQQGPLVVPQGGSVVFPGEQRFGLTNPKTFAPLRPTGRGNDPRYPGAAPTQTFNPGQIKWDSR